MARTSIIQKLSRFSPLTCILLLAIFFRIHGISRPIWLDEQYSLATLKVNLFTNPLFYNVEIHQPLYYYYLRVWYETLKLLGAGDIIFYRLSGILVAVATVIFVYTAFSKIKGKPFATIFTLLIAITPLQVYYSQEIRAYSLLGSLIIVQLFFFYMIYTKTKVDSRIPDPVHWYAIFGALALFTHLTMVFLVFSYALVSFLLHKQLGYSARLNKFTITNLFLLVFATILIFLTRLNPMYSRASDAFTPYVGGFSGLSLQFIIETLNKFKETLTMYYWYGYSYPAVAIIVQSIFKKAMLLLLLAGIAIPFIKAKKKGPSFDQIVIILFLLTLIEIYIAEKAGIYPFSGRYIMPFGLIFLYIIANPLHMLWDNTRTRIITIIILGILGSLFYFHEWCYNDLKSQNFDRDHSWGEAYGECIKQRN